MADVLKHLLDIARSPGTEAALERLLDKISGNVEVWSEVVTIAAGAGSTTRTYNSFPDRRIVLEGVSLFVRNGTLTADVTLDIRAVEVPRTQDGISAGSRDPDNRRSIVLGNGAVAGDFTAYTPTPYGMAIDSGRHLGLLIGGPTGADLRLAIWGFWENKPRRN